MNTSVSNNNTIIVSAESGRLHGVEIASETPDFTGIGYVKGTHKDGDWFEVDVHIAESGHYDFSIRYAIPDGRRTNAICIDGAFYGYIISSRTEGFITERQCTVRLTEGVHTVSILKAWDNGADVDCFMFTQTPAPVLDRSPRTLINPNASAETLSLWNYLNSLFGNATLTGQHTASSFTPAKEFEYIRAVTGKQPAIRGFDLLSYTLATETAEPTPHKLLEIEENKGSIEARPSSGRPFITAS
ncbi:CBM35 domain-containing protein [Paenibacillus sp. OV219]|uniref:CBM35 domain-containing protein n=1 Tax=Paenibacillus sp. OV219 TaxID=1884377 RepID=UPI0008C49261|nr:CBM35 domain-containing protein [Paenibacillus sp. OV219]SEO81479.1 mannan endo-1,4-beta-mannosidase [Paenibacillus sp. OV219]